MSSHVYLNRSGKSYSFKSGTSCGPTDYSDEGNSSHMFYMKNCSHLRRFSHVYSHHSCTWSLCHIFHKNRPSHPCAYSCDASGLDVAQPRHLQSESSCGTTELCYEESSSHMFCRIGFSSMWVLMWPYKVLLNLKLSLHILQAKCFSPVWIVTWVKRWAFCLKLFLNVLQSNDFTPVWILKCHSTKTFFQNAFPQTSHLKDFSYDWVLNGLSHIYYHCHFFLEGLFSGFI